MRGKIPYCLTAVVACGLIAGCGGNGPAYYLAGGSASVLLVQWSAPQNGQASGTVTYDSFSGSAPNESLSVDSTPVAVVISGSSITITPTGFGALSGVTITGTLGGGGLTINMPPNSTTGQIGSETLAASNATGYNAAVSALRKTIASQNTTALAQQQEQQQAQQITSDQQTVGNDVSTLRSDSGNLSSDVSQLASDVQQVNSDLGQVKSDTANGQGSYCDNVYTVADDAYTVSDDSDTLSDDLMTLTDDISTVQGDIRQLNNDLSTLAQAGGTQSGDPQAAISQAKADINSAVSSANTDISTVNADVGDAYSIANGLATGSCSGGGPGSTPSPITAISG
jgi:predicted  nucleic acid-binding Zn-ribbon protein